MQAFHPLFHFNVPIPVWQIVLFVGLMSIFLIAHKVRFSLITSYLFILFWLYYSFRGDLVSVTRQDFVVKTVYDLFGFVLVGLGVFAFFFLERGKEVLLENLKKRNGEIADLKFKLKKAEKKTRAIETEVEETQSSIHAQASGLKKILDAKIDELEDRLENREALLEKRDGEIAAFKLKAEEAEKKAHALETQVEESQGSFHTGESALKKKLAEELNAKIGELEDRLKDRDSLLEKRHGEIENLKLKAAEAEKKEHALKTHAEETQKRARALETQIEEIQRSFHAQESALKKKLDAKIDELEHRLKETAGHLEKRDGEIADFKLKAEEAEKRTRDLKTRVNETQRSFNTRESALKNKLEEELNAKIDQLENRAKERESLLEKRAGEIAAFKLKAEEAEKKAQALKMQAEETQQSFRTQESALKKSLEQNQNAKIGELEHRLKERESLLEKRDGEVTNFKLKAEEAEKRAYVLKTQVEEAQKTAQKLMTQVAETQRSSQSQESALKKKLAEELNAKIGELEDRLKDSEGLLEKRAGEIANFKLKAEEAEKRAHALKMQAEETQKRANPLRNQEQKDRPGAKAQDSNHKNLEQELKDKILEIKDLQEQVNHKDGLLNLMAKRNRELADLKSNADQRIEVLEARWKDSQPALRTEDSGNSHSNPDQNQKPRHT